MAPWREARTEKAQFGDLLKIAPFCGVQQWHLQSRDGSDMDFYDWLLRPQRSYPEECALIAVEALLGCGTCP